MSLVPSGRIADVVLLVMVAEGILLVRAGRGWRPVIGALLPGALLVLALRAALDGAPVLQVALLLTLSLPAHLLDLRSRGWIGGWPAIARLRMDGRRLRLARSARQPDTPPA